MMIKVYSKFMAGLFPYNIFLQHSNHHIIINPTRHAVMVWLINTLLVIYTRQPTHSSHPRGHKLCLPAFRVGYLMMLVSRSMRRLHTSIYMKKKVEEWEHLKKDITSIFALLLPKRILWFCCWCCCWEEDGWIDDTKTTMMTTMMAETRSWKGEQLYNKATICDAVLYCSTW